MVVTVGRERPNSALIGRICDACISSLPVTGASVSAVFDLGRRGTVYATNATAERVEDLQFELGEGPGADAFRERRPVFVTDLDDPAEQAESRWPVFTPAALQTGARSVFAYPLLLGAAEIGLLGMYRDQPLTLDSPGHARAVRLADAAMFALLNLFDDPVPPDPDEPFEASGLAGDDGFFRAEVYQAAGMVTVQLGVSIEEAIARLRAYAFAHGRALVDVASDIVARRLRLEAENE